MKLEQKKALRTSIVFLAVFVSAMGLFSIGAPVIEPWCNRVTARTTAALLNLLGADGWCAGSTVHSRLGSFEVIWECTAITPCLVFLSAIIAYPSAWKAKVLGMVLGTPSILIVNIVRLVGLVYVDHLFPDMLEVAHLVVGQTLMLLATLVLWMLWIVRLT